MTKAPKRVWMDGDIEVGEGYWIRCFEDPKPCSQPAIEYVRGDILYNQTHLIAQLFTLLEVTEATDEGRVFHPTTIRSCRVLDAEKLDKILAELKATIPPVLGVGNTLLEVSVLAYPMLPTSKFEVNNE